MYIGIVKVTSCGPFVYKTYKQNDVYRYTSNTRYIAVMAEMQFSISLLRALIFVLARVSDI